MAPRDEGMALMTVLWLMAGMAWLLVQWTNSVQQELPFLRDTQTHVQQQVQASNRWQCLRQGWLREGRLPPSCLNDGAWHMVLTPPETSLCPEYGAAHRCIHQTMTLRQRRLTQHYRLVNIYPPESAPWRAAYVCTRQRCTSTSS